MRTRILRKPQNREMSDRMHKHTVGLRRRWANKPLDTFPEAKTAFRTAISYRFAQWLNQNRDVFIANRSQLRACLGLIFV